MPEKQLRLRRAGPCTACGAGLPVGTPAWWDADARTLMCLACHGPLVGSARAEVMSAAPVLGNGGASAQREYERRSVRELARKEKAVADDAEHRVRLKASRPVLGRLAVVVTPKPRITPESQPTTAWATGAEGERKVAEVLDSCAGVHALHDRLIPGSKANIDHIAVAANGVYVIDAKRYEGKVECRDVGGWRTADERLFVNGRDRTKLVLAMARQVAVVAAILESESRIPVRPVLCFVGAEWPVLRRRALSVKA